MNKKMYEFHYKRDAYIGFFGFILMVLGFAYVLVWGELHLSNTILAFSIIFIAIGAYLFGFASWKKEMIDDYEKATGKSFDTGRPPPKKRKTL